jgi:two-component system NtrC family response regulator
MVADVRIVSASNRNLARMIVDGTFREDLYFRINELQILLPPLRARDKDVLLIARTLHRRYAALYKRGQLELSAGALAAIARYEWPGNVRELQNRIKRAVLLCQGSRTTAKDLGFNDACEDGAVLSLKDIRRAAERDAISKALALHDYNMSQAAKALGVSRTTLYSHISEYEIPLPR